MLSALAPSVFDMVLSLPLWVGKHSSLHPFSNVSFHLHIKHTYLLLWYTDFQSFQATSGAVTCLPGMLGFHFIPLNGSLSDQWISCLPLNSLGKSETSCSGFSPTSGGTVTLGVIFWKPPYVESNKINQWLPSSFLGEKTQCFQTLWQMLCISVFFSSLTGGLKVGKE